MALVRIAICDDEKDAVAMNERIVKDSLQSCGIGYEITTYTCGSNLLCHGYGALRKDKPADTVPAGKIRKHYQKASLRGGAFSWTKTCRSRT